MTRDQVRSVRLDDSQRSSQVANDFNGQGKPAELVPSAEITTQIGSNILLRGDRKTATEIHITHDRGDTIRNKNRGKAKLEHGVCIGQIIFHEVEKITKMLYIYYLPVPFDSHNWRFDRITDPSLGFNRTQTDDCPVHVCFVHCKHCSARQRYCKTASGQ